MAVVQLLLRAIKALTTSDMLCAVSTINQMIEQGLVSSIAAVPASLGGQLACESHYFT